MTARKAWKVCVTLHIASPNLPWWGSLAGLRVKYRAVRLRGSFLQDTLPPLRSLYVLCVLCVCCVCAVSVCVCVCAISVCVEITVLTKATVSGSVGPVYRRDFLAPRSARCSEPYVPSKLLLRLFWAVGSSGGVGGVGEGGEGVGGEQQQGGGQGVRALCFLFG